MAANVIVLTANPNYWSQNLQKLDELGRYQVLIRSINDLTLPSGIANHAVILLDFDPLQMNAIDQGLEDLGRRDGPLIVITALPDLLPEKIFELNPVDILQKPVDTDELIDLINVHTGYWSSPDRQEQLLHDMDISQSAWDEDVQQAARHLAQLSLETYAQAALIANNGVVWAYAGQLLQAQAEELVDLIYAHWVEGSEKDLARYVRLGSNGKDYMLYATSLQPSYILALAFDAQLPFGEIRAQANAFAKKLTRVEVMAMASNNEPAPEDPPDKRSGLPMPEDWQEEVNRPLVQSKAIEDILSALEIPQDQEEDMPIIGNVRENDEPQLQRPKYDPASDRQHYPHQNAERVQRSQNKIPLLQLDYCGMLITRLPEHGINQYLDLLLSKWFPKLCLAYGWQLKKLLIEDESISWVVSTLGREAPVDMVSIIGSKLSERIFRVFPSYYDDNPSGEYWAIPFYLETCNSVPSDARRISIVNQVRVEQGI